MQALIRRPPAGTESWFDATQTDGGWLPPFDVAVGMAPTILQPVSHTSASTVMALESALTHIEQWYVVPQPESVRRFVRLNPGLATLLIEATNPLNRLFGPAPHVSLRVLADPEVEDAEELFAYIRVALPPDEALESMDRLDEEWFLDQLNRANGKFNFNLEFV